MAVGGAGCVQRVEVILGGRVVQHPAGTERGLDGAVGHLVAHVAERGVRFAGGVDVERVLDLVAHGVDPFLMAAVSVVCDAEVAGPWLDGVGFLPQFLGLGCVVLQVVAVLLQLLHIFGDER